MKRQAPDQGGKAAKAPRFVPAPLDASGRLKSERNKFIADKRDKDSKNTRYAWLNDAKDPAGKRVGEEGYDPRRLYIPPNALANMTDFERQYWEIKRSNWDVVVFFKKGKFYELYEKDAIIGHNEFFLKMTPRVNMCMVGVPESSFNQWAKQFIYKGYKVGRVEQTEYRLTKKATDKSLVQRELCQIITLGTLCDEDMLVDYKPNYLLALKEDPTSRTFGVCFVDTSRGKIHITKLEDNAQRAQLSTLLHQTKPKELLLEKGNLSKESIGIIKYELMDPLLNYLTANKEYLTAADVRGNYLETEMYFKKGEVEVIEKYQDDDLVMSAFGACLWYLKELKLDEEIFPMKNFVEHGKEIDNVNNLILDGIALSNLEILENSRDKGLQGTLMNYLQHCVTPYGKRELKRWVCNPLKDISAINRRLDAVQDLLDNPEAQRIIESFRHIGDLDRQIGRIFAGGRPSNAKVAWVDQDLFSKRQVSLFLSTEKGFRKIHTAFTQLHDMPFQSSHMKSLCCIASKDGNGQFPDLEEVLNYFEKSFDHDQAQSTGYLTPNTGVNPDYDNFMEEIEELDDALDDQLRQFQQRFHDKRICYRNIGKDTYQIEIPKGVVKGKLPSNFRLMSNTAKVDRYYTSEVETIAKQKKEKELKRDEARCDVLRDIMAQFGEYRTQWWQAIQAAAELDCLYSLSVVSRNENMCRPTFLPSDSVNGPQMSFQSLCHPCAKPAIGSKATSVVPNDVTIGGKDCCAILITGPNMGGKSTIMRAVCIAAVMAQLGCYVCAEECSLTPIDRIFTRIGAHDSIMSGQSTFMVELDETSNILQHATKDSLIIMDELGRGTSTFDGYAIAYATLKHIVNTVACRTLFATHYFLLTEEMARECPDTIGNYHMHYSVEEETGEVTFLYKFLPGACQRSYGIDVARKAGLMAHLLTRAQTISSQFEEESSLQEYTKYKYVQQLTKELVKNLESKGSMTELQELQEKVKKYLTTQ